MRSLDPSEDFAITLVRRFLLLCEHPRTRDRMLRMVRDSTQHGPDGPRLSRWVNRAVLSPMLRRRVTPMSAMKVELIASQLVGLATVRYVLEIEPIASASVDEVISLAAPAVNAVLRGEESLTSLVGSEGALVAAGSEPAVRRGRRLPVVGAVVRRAVGARARA